MRCRTAHTALSGSAHPAHTPARTAPSLPSHCSLSIACRPSIRLLNHCIMSGMLPVCPVSYPPGLYLDREVPPEVPPPLPAVYFFRYLRGVFDATSGKLRVYRYVIGNIGVMGVAQTAGTLGGEGGGGEIHGPQNHSSCVRVDTPVGEDAADCGPVAGKVAARVWDAPAENQGCDGERGPCCGGGCGRRDDGGSRRVRERRRPDSGGHRRGCGDRFE